MKRIRAAVVGLGYWGPNLARNIQVGDDYTLVALVDPDAPRLKRIGAQYPSAHCYSTLPEALAGARPELVVIASPPATHYELCLEALHFGCHVLCEKPLATTSAQAARLVDEASRLRRSLFVDHTFVYTSAVRAIHSHYVRGDLGQLLYVDSTRINLGLFQRDVDVIWDLAPHDLSIIDFVASQRVRSLQASGLCRNPCKLTDVAHVALEYETGLRAYLHLSWLSPVKVRRMIFTGSRSTLIYDDLEASEKIRIYDSGVDFDVDDQDARMRMLVSYRRGDMRAPALGNVEALAVQLSEIARALRGEELRLTTGEDGLAVLRVLEATKRSLAADGARMPVV